MLREQSLTNASPREDVPRARPRLQPRRCSERNVEEEKRAGETQPELHPAPERVRPHEAKVLLFGVLRVFFRSAFPEEEGFGGFAVDVLQLSGGGINPHRTAAVCPGEGAWEGGGKREKERGSGEVHCSHTERVRSFSFSFIIFKGRKVKTQTLQPVLPPLKALQPLPRKPPNFSPRVCIYIFIYVRASVRAASRDGLMGSGSSAGRPRPPRTAPRGRSASAPRCAPPQLLARSKERGEAQKGRTEGKSLPRPPPPSL